jgi:hypothetical protein
MSYTKENPLVINTPEEARERMQEIQEVYKTDKDAVSFAYAQNTPVEPPAEPVNPQGGPNPPVTFNEEEWLRNTFGENVTVTSLLEERSKLNTLSQRAQELEQLATMTVNPFADESIARINEFVKKTGIKDLGVAQTILNEEKLNSLSFEDAIVLHKRLSGVNLAESDIRNAVREDFGYTEEDGEPRYTREASLKVQGTEAKSALSKTGSEIQLPTTSALQEQLRQAKEAQQTQLIQQWEPELKLMQHKPPVLKVKYGEQDNEAVEIVIPNDYIGQRTELLKNQMVSSGKAVSPEAKAELENQVVAMYRFENFDTILKNTVAYERARMEQEYSGAKPPVRQVPPGTPAPSNLDVIRQTMREKGRL